MLYKYYYDLRKILETTFFILLISSYMSISFAETSKNIASCYGYILVEVIENSGQNKYKVIFESGGNNAAIIPHYLPDNPSLCENGYTVTEGEKRTSTSPGQANLIIGCQDRPNIIYGSNGTDYICGGPYDDFINGRKSNDFINGRGGNDIIHGGSGQDLLRGGKGSDEIYGDRGNDCVLGDKGNDFMLSGGPNTDLCDSGSDSGTIDDASCESRSLDHCRQKLWPEFWNFENK